MAKEHVAEGSVFDLAMGLRKARVINGAAAIYVEAKLRLEAERLIAQREAELLADTPSLSSAQSSTRVWMT